MCFLSTFVKTASLVAQAAIGMWGGICRGQNSIPPTEANLLNTAIEWQKAKIIFQQSTDNFSSLNSLAYNTEGSWDENSVKIENNLKDLLAANAKARDYLNKMSQVYKKYIASYLATNPEPPPPQDPPLPSSLTPLLHWADALNNSLPTLSLPKNFFLYHFDVLNTYLAGSYQEAARHGAGLLISAGYFPQERLISQVLESSLFQLLISILQEPLIIVENKSTILPGGNDIRTHWFNEWVTGDQLYQFAIDHPSPYLSQSQLEEKKIAWDKKRKIINRKAPKGIQWVEHFPDFSPHVKKNKRGIPIEVVIPLSGKRNTDRKRAEIEATQGPNPLITKNDLNALQGFVWHHAPHQFLKDPAKKAPGWGLMQLIPEDLHNSVPHLGGYGEFRESQELEKEAM